MTIFISSVKHPLPDAFSWYLDEKEYHVLGCGRFAELWPLQ